MDTLKSILGDNAEDTIRSVMGSLSGGEEDRSGDAARTEQNSAQNNIDPENLAYLMQMKELMTKFADSRNDSRSNLLMSLRPYMRDTRKRSIDSAVRLLNISKLAGLLRM